jgi:uncharacterized protein with von Willebrand factor type A (vWA) domain
MNSHPPLLSLFHQLRQAGMKLTPEQYDLLQQALQQGHGVGGWEDLKRVCQLLWVKPSPNYDRHLFEQTFDRYAQAHQRQFETYTAPPPATAISVKPTVSPPVPPQVPPRRMPDRQSTGEIQAPIAIKTAPPTLRPPTKPNWITMPTVLPLSLRSIQSSWRSLRRPVRSGLATEVDLAATLDQINQNGYFGEVVLRPERRQRSNLLLLVDDSDAMLPFRPALDLLITAVIEHRITPAEIYRFTVYPEDYLYDWNQPFKAIPLPTVLSRLHRSRTIVVIVSDGGAATATNRVERQLGIATFLEQLLPCIHQLLWLNPLPPERWQSTTAQTIAQALNGRMIPLDSVRLQAVAREQPSNPMIKLWSLLPPIFASETT